MHYMTVKTCREKVIVLWFYHILKTLHLQQLKNKRYTKKGVPFLSKMVYKRVRGWTILGRSLHAWNFVCIPPGADQFYFFGGNQNSNSPPHVFSSDVFKRRTSTRRGIFVFFSSDFEHLLSQIVSKLLVKTLSNTNLVALYRPGLSKEKKGQFWLQWLEDAMIFDTTKTPLTIDSYYEDNNNNKARKPLIYTDIAIFF